MWAELAKLAELSEAWGISFLLVFCRVAAIAALLPGFGERSVPTRVKLALALAFSVLSWPLIPDLLRTSIDTPVLLFTTIANEILIGVAFGLSIRLMILALQFAGSIASQSTALAQIMGAGATPDPMPAMGNILVIAGIALALTADLHIRAVLGIVETYLIFPVGRVPDLNDLTTWGVASATSAVALAFSLAAPFVIASLVYNVTLGFINRAMPQLMVAFIFAPAITFGGLAILLIASPVILGVWLSVLNDVFSAPFGLPR